MSNWESTLEVHASAARTVTGVGATIDLGSRDRLLRQTLNISASSGTGQSIAVRLEASADGATAWKTFGAFTQTTGVASEKVSLIAPARYIRPAWIVAGSAPSFTFSVTGTKGLSFVNADDLDAFGMPNAALASISATKKAEAAAAVTEMASGMLAARYDLPIVTWGTDLVQACSKVLAYELLSVRGFNPDGEDDNIRRRHDDGLKWLRAVASYEINPVGLVDSAPEDDVSGGSEVVTHAARGWR